jgi:hypothetical protein
MSIDINGAEIAATARRAAETAARVAGDRIQDLSRVFDEMGRGFGGAGTIRWQDDDTVKPMVSPKSAPKRTLIKM